MTFILCMNASVGIALCSYYRGYCSDPKHFFIESFVFAAITIMLWITLYIGHKNTRVAYNQKIREHIEDELSQDSKDMRYLKTRENNVNYKVQLAKDSYNIEINLVSSKVIV